MANLFFIYLFGEMKVRKVLDSLFNHPPQKQIDWYEFNTELIPVN